MAGTTNGDPQSPSTLEFQGTTQIKLAPSETRTLRVVVGPPGIYLVRFGLLGDPADASLDQSEVETTSDGVAEVVLTAPSTERLFQVRASVGTALSAFTGIAVGKGFATLHVQHSYDGRRPIAYWVASVRTGATCADLAGNPPPDGTMVAQALPDKDPVIDTVPAETTLAVTLRAARSIGGCTVVKGLAPNSVNEVVVPITDVPVQLDRADLDFSLSIDAGAANISAILDKTENLMVERLTGGQLSDITTLLDAMGDAAEPAQKSDFVAQRTRGDWDTWVTLALGLGSSSKLRRPVHAWFGAAKQQLLEREMLSGVLLTSQDAADSVRMRLERVFDYDPIEAGFSPALASRFSVAVEPGDSLVVGGTLEWFPPQLLGRIGGEIAMTKGSGAPSAPAALAAELPCQTVADELREHGVDAAQVFAGCNHQCAKDLCEQAVTELWNRMIDVTELPPAKLVLSATGPANINEFAHVATVDGIWNANLDFAGVTGKLTGELQATGVPSPPPTQ